MNKVKRSYIEFLSRPGAERLPRTIFWTLWAISVASITYAIAAEMFGLSLFYPNFGSKYHVFTIEYPVLGAITSNATIMLAFTTAVVWRLAPRLRKFGIAACILELFYVSIPRI